MGFQLFRKNKIWEGASRRGPLEWGRGMANLSSYQLEGKGAWGRCVPPIPFVPWGYRSLEPGEKGSFWRPEGGVIYWAEEWE